MRGTARIVHRSANHPDFEREQAAAIRAQVQEMVSGLQVRRRMGLGDLVYRVAHPIGCAMDRWTTKGPQWARTRLCGCLACSARRRRWNAWLPDVRGWQGGWQEAFRRLLAALKSP